MLGIEYILCSMASQCVSAISALHPSIAALGKYILACDWFENDIISILITLSVIHLSEITNNWYHARNSDW